MQCALNVHSIQIRSLESSQLYLLQCSNDSRPPRHTHSSATQRSKDFTMSSNNFLKAQPYNIPTTDSAHRSREFQTLLLASARNSTAITQPKYLGNIIPFSHGHVTESNRVKPELTKPGLTQVKPGCRSHDRIRKNVLQRVFKMALGVTTHFGCFSGDLQRRRPV